MERTNPDVNVTMTYIDIEVGLMEEGILQRCTKPTHYMQLDPDRQGELDGELTGLYCQVSTAERPQYCPNHLGANPRSISKRFDLSPGSNQAQWAIQWLNFAGLGSKSWWMVLRNCHWTDIHHMAVNTRTIQAGDNRWEYFVRELTLARSPLSSSCHRANNCLDTKDCTDDTFASNKDVCMWGRYVRHVKSRIELKLVTLRFNRPIMEKFASNTNSGRGWHSYNRCWGHTDLCILQRIWSTVNLQPRLLRAL